MKVREGTAHTRAAVQAESIREAMNITRERSPNYDVRVVFLITPEDFFIEDPAEGKSRGDAYWWTAFHRKGAAKWSS